MEVNCEIKEKIVQLLIEITGNSELSTEMEGSTDIINDIGLDSIQMINFVLVLEDEFGIQLDFETFDFSVFNSIDALSSFIASAVELTAVS